MTILKRNWGIIGILFITALLLMPATQARAETVKFRLVSYLTKAEWSPVGDVKGHVVGFYSRRGLAFFENGEVAKLTVGDPLDGGRIMAISSNSVLVQKAGYTRRISQPKSQRTRGRTGG